MFVCSLASLTTTTNTKARSRVQQLSTLSELCESAGLAPAQGLRIIKRNWHTSAHEFLQLSANQLSQLVNDILSSLQLRATQVIYTTQQFPEHFLHTTIIPTALNTHQGYVSPVVNIYPDIHFVRTQRRFNKRRYARVRAVSRPSFWSGMMLSTLATGAFWGATMQASDWTTVKILIPDPSILLVVLTLLLVTRGYNLYTRASAPYARELNRARRGWLKLITV